MSCTALGNIARVECGASPGGLVTEILVARVSDVEEVPGFLADGITLDGDILLKQTAAGPPIVRMKWISWQFEMNFGELMSEVEGDRSQSVKADLDVFIPGGDAVTDAVLNNAINGKFLVLVKQKDGAFRLLGTADSPAKLTQKFATGKLGKDAKGFDLKFSADGLLTHPPYYVGGIEIQA